jgi:hypothetical protein
MNVLNKRILQTICLWLQRLCERQRGRKIIEEEQMANHYWKEDILFLVVMEERHWMLKDREEDEDIVFISKPFIFLFWLQFLKKVKDILKQMKIKQQFF